MKHPMVMMKLLCAVCAVVIANGILAVELSSRRYHEPRPLTEMKAALDTVKSWDDQMAVVADFLKQYPKELELQFFALGFRLADNPRMTRADFEKKLQENPGDIAALFLAGRAAATPDERLNFAERILEKDVQNYWGLLLLAWHYASLESPNVDKAEENYLKAISADNSLPYAFRELGKLYQTQGQKEKADEMFVLLGQMMPEKFEPVRMRVGLKGANYQEALALTREFLKEYPTNSAALETEARLERELKDWRGYIDACRRLHAAKPEGDNAYNLACAFSLGGETDSAFTYLKFAAQKGFTDLEQYKEDEDLIPLHDDKRWSELLVTVETAYVQEMMRQRQEAIATKTERKEKAVGSRQDMPAPDWALKDFSGNEVSLAALRGNVVIIDFWATWCGPCRKTMPLIDKFFQENKRPNVKVFGINVWERQKDPEKVKSFVKSNGFKFPILFGDDKVASNYGVKSIPTLFVIQPDGKIAYRHVGYNPNIMETLTWQVDEILKSKKSEVRDE
ncbi:MAG: redoxin domain-containing protein [bacterium]